MKAYQFPAARLLRFQTVENLTVSVGNDPEGTFGEGDELPPENNNGG